jgi:hypothetical protein
MTSSRLRNRLTILFVMLAAAALAACETTGSTPGPQAAASPAAPPAPPMDRARAATECWMATEKGHADQPLDKRADIVTKCIDEKMKSAKADLPKS